MNRISENINVEIPVATKDIGGTDCWGGSPQAGWVPLNLFDTFMAVVKASPTWNAADTFGALRIEQATSVLGAGKKPITTSVITLAASIQVNNVAVLECCAASLDVENGFTHVRAFVSGSGDTGEDLVTVVYLRANARYANALLTTPVPVTNIAP